MMQHLLSFGINLTDISIPVAINWSMWNTSACWRQIRTKSGLLAQYFLRVTGPVFPFVQLHSFYQTYLYAILRILTDPFNVSIAAEKRLQIRAIGIHFAWSADHLVI